LPESQAFRLRSLPLAALNANGQMEPFVRTMARRAAAR
jgi:hypothetical protein